MAFTTYFKKLPHEPLSDEDMGNVLVKHGHDQKYHKRHLMLCNHCLDTNAHIRARHDTKAFKLNKPLSLTLQIEDFTPPKFDLPSDILSNPFIQPLSAMSTPTTFGLQSLLIAVLGILLALSALLNIIQRKQINDFEDSLPAVLRAPSHEPSADMIQYSSSFLNEVIPLKPAEEPVKDVAVIETDNEDFKAYQDTFESETILADKTLSPLSTSSTSSPTEAVTENAISPVEAKRNAERAQVASQEGTTRDAKRVRNFERDRVFVLEAKRKIEGEQLARESQRLSRGKSFKQSAIVTPPTEELASTSVEDKISNETNSQSEQDKDVTQLAASSNIDSTADIKRMKPKSRLSKLFSFRTKKEPDADAERLAKLEAERLASQKAERLAKLELERLARLESDRIAQLEADEQTKREAERVAMLEAERLANLEAERLARVEAEREVILEAERFAKIEADWLANLESERLVKIEAERQSMLEAAEQVKSEARRKADAMKVNIISLSAAGGGISVLQEYGPKAAQLARRFDDLLNLLKLFRCNKSAAMRLYDRLIKCSSVIASILEDKGDELAESEYRPEFDDLCEVMIKGKKYFLKFAEDGYLQASLPGRQPREMYEECDRLIVDALAKLLMKLQISAESWNTLEVVAYDDVVTIDQTMLDHASSDMDAMKELTKIIGLPLAELQGEVADAIKRIEILRLDVAATGPQCHIKHPAVRTFWYMCMNPEFKSDYKTLVDASTQHVRAYVKPMRTDEEIDNIMQKFLDILILVDENHDDSISVFEYNQNTKRMDPYLDYLAVIELLIVQTTKRIYPAVSKQMKAQLVWGRSVEAAVMRSLTSSSIWTIVYGPSQAGKSYCYLLSVDQLHHAQSVIWIDFRGVKTVNDVLSTVATQLSLCVLSLDDVVLEFQRLLDANIAQSESRCSIVLDHVDLEHLDILASFIRGLKKCKQSSNIAVVIISIDHSMPSDSQIEALQTIGKISLERASIRSLFIEALHEDEATKLATYLDVQDPSLLIAAAKLLPGNIYSMQSLSIEDLERISVALEEKHSHNILFDTLSDMERLIAAAIYYPLSSGMMFHLALVWDLSHDYADDNLILWNSCISHLIEIGWLGRIGDEGLMIASTSTMPTTTSASLSSSIIITENDQWERYYRYWTTQAVHINALLHTRNQLLGCSYFDSSRKHFEILFIDWAASPALYNRLRPAVLLELTCFITGEVSYLLEYRFTPDEGLQLSKGITRVLCDNHDDAMLVDGRYWQQQHQASLKLTIIRAVINVGWFQHRTGHTSDAETIIIHALHHINEADGLEYAYGLNKLAIIMRALNRKEESLSTHEACLNLRLSIIGEMHTETAQSLNNIAIVLLTLQRKQEALDAHLRCLAIRLHLLGEKHVATGDTFYNMASVYLALHQQEDAIWCYDKAKLAYIATYGQKHSFVRDVNDKLKQLQDPALLDAASDTNKWQPSPHRTPPRRRISSSGSPYKQG